MKPAVWVLRGGPAVFFAEIRGLADFYLRKEDYGIAVSKPKISSERNELLDRINLALVRLKSSGRYDEILHRYLGNQRN